LTAGGLRRDSMRDYARIMSKGRYIARIMVVILVVCIDQVFAKLFALSSTDTLLLCMVMMVTVVFINQVDTR